MSNFIDVFRYSGAEMRRKGNFFALMFFVLGIGSMAAYFAVGWLANGVAMVRSLTHWHPVGLD